MEGNEVDNISFIPCFYCGGTFFGTLCLEEHWFCGKTSRGYVQKTNQELRIYIIKFQSIFVGRGYVRILVMEWLVDKKTSS